MVAGSGHRIQFVSDQVDRATVGAVITPSWRGAKLGSIKPMVIPVMSSAFQWLVWNPSLPVDIRQLLTVSENESSVPLVKLRAVEVNAPALPRDRGGPEPEHVQGAWGHTARVASGGEESERVANLMRRDCFEVGQPGSDSVAGVEVEVENRVNVIVASVAPKAPSSPP